MNRREKRVLTVTGAMVLATVVSLAIKDRSEPAQAQAREESPPNDIIPIANSAVDPQAVRAESHYSQLEVQRQLDRFRRPPSLALPSDPFSGVGAGGDRRAKPVVPPEGLPTIGGLSYSSPTDCSAVLDGELVFLGETHGNFRLAAVDHDGITLESKGHRYRIAFNPLTGNGPVRGVRR